MSLSRHRRPRSPEECRRRGERNEASRSSRDGRSRRRSPSKRRERSPQPKRLRKDNSEPLEATVTSGDQDRKEAKLRKFKEKMAMKMQAPETEREAVDRTQEPPEVESEPQPMRSISLLLKNEKRETLDKPFDEMTPEDFGISEPVMSKYQASSLFSGGLREEERYHSSDDEEHKVYDPAAVREEIAKEKTPQRKELSPVNHSQIAYPLFTKNLYVQVREITRQTDAEVESFRRVNGNIRIRGRQAPRPVASFFQCGLTDTVLRHLAKRGCSVPFPIQMQAIPALMCGRDVIGIAETGSGKTLAYLLPMLRHVKAQPPVKDGEGPIGLVLAPTRELAVQISHETERYSSLVGVRCVACYGGSGIGNQVNKLRRGVEIVIGTPGRMIDVLTISNGKVTNLRRVTFCVLDEADRMFDLGFEPQITMMLRTIRPDRQLCMFSATFPIHIEHLARKILRKPLEVSVGEKGQTASHIAQYLELRTEEDKFNRLLQLLGEWCEHGSIIVFVDRQVEADALFANLHVNGYDQTKLLHGGLDHTDRELTIQEFKTSKQLPNVLVATSVAARGLDVPSVNLVVNYVVPDHLEDYVHRIGRTGRAGNIGCAYTFITEAEADRAEELCGVLKQGGQDPGPEVQRLADDFKIMCNTGGTKAIKPRKKGYGGRGFTFSELSRLSSDREKAKKELGIGSWIDDTDEGIKPAAAKGAAPYTGSVGVSGVPTLDALTHGLVPLRGFSAGSVSSSISSTNQLSDRDLEMAAYRMAENAMESSNLDDSERRNQIESMIPALKMFLMKNTQQALNLLQGVPNTTDSVGSIYSQISLGIKNEGLSANGYVDPLTHNSVDTVEINDFPGPVRSKLSQKDSLEHIAELCDVVMQVKGQFVSEEMSQQNPTVALMMKKLYIEIIAPTTVALSRAKHELALLADQQLKAMA